MTSSNDIQICLNCGHSEKDIPLISLRYAGNQAFICSQCMPVLIHEPQRMAEKLNGSAFSREG